MQQRVSSRVVCLMGSCISNVLLGWLCICMVVVHQSSPAIEEMLPFRLDLLGYASSMCAHAQLSFSPSLLSAFGHAGPNYVDTVQDLRMTC